MKVLNYRVADEPVKVYFPTALHEAADFLAWVDQGHHLLAVDTEATGLAVFARHFQARLVQFGTRDEAWVLRADLFADAIRAALQRQARFLAHNAIFDALVLDQAGLAPLETFMPKVIDTGILSRLHDPRGPDRGGVGHELKQLAAHYVDAKVPDAEKELVEVFRKEYRCGKAEGYARIAIDHPVYVLYAGLDVIVTARLFEVLGPMVRERGFGKLASFEHALAALMARLQRRGIRLDVLYTERLSKDLQAQSAEAAKRARYYGVENVNSTAQLAEALQGMGWTPTEFTEKAGAPKVDKRVLEGLVAKGNPLAAAVMESKRAGKWRTSYTEAMLLDRDINDRVHPSINPLQARTGRMSVSKPPLQQLPSSDWTVRRCLIADPGMLMGGVDYQAVELRVLAALANVRRMKEAIANGEDLHGFTAALVYGPDYTPAHRKLMKGVGFGKVYGGGAATLARQSGAPLDAVQQAIREYDRVYPEVKRWARRLQDHAQFGAREVVTPSGRHLPLDRDRTFAATNYMVQSTARDLLAQALLDLDDAGLEPYLLLPVHDEVVFQAPAAEAQDVATAIGLAMESVFYGVPIATDGAVYGPSWGHGYGAPS